MNIHWEAEKYREGFSFVPHYGEDVLDLITEEPGQKKRAVDLGCGNGALTAKLAERGFSTLGIDDSAEMLDAAGKLHPELHFGRGNALDFVLEEKADVLFSNAVFHWIDAADQEKLAGNLFAQLKNGGQLVCEFGGKGCAETIHSELEHQFEKRGLRYPRVFYFPTIGEYASILEKAGFRVEYAVLFDRPTPQKGPDGLAEWVRMFVKAPFDGMAADQKEEIIGETQAALKEKLFLDGRWIVDYVRIRVRAVKGK